MTIAGEFSLLSFFCLVRRANFPKYSDMRVGAWSLVLGSVFALKYFKRVFTVPLYGVVGVLDKPHPPCPAVGPLGLAHSVANM